MTVISTEKLTDSVLHRAAPYDPDRPRDMHSKTFAGDEAIQ
ncbi:MAG TPA: hypothetical protein VJM33_02115 [Microthrixaceae bacterium]|nr:hypothetical protein [Microthrixaceae bacterium]